MARITFDRSLYTPEAVEAAAAAYAEYADIALAVIDAVTGGDRQTIENSFCNLALQETIVRMRRAPAPEDE